MHTMNLTRQNPLVRYAALSLALAAAIASAQTLQIEPASAGSAKKPMLQPAKAENFIVYKEAGRYGGWPANHGLWQWGNELVVGFTSTWYKKTEGHQIDRSKPSYEWQARSLDGGRTWKTESDLPFADREKEAKPSSLKEPIDFTAKDFALMFRFGGLHDGPSWFYTTTDRCKTWKGPYSFEVPGVEKICTRTDLIVLGPKDCLMFGSCAKKNDGKEGRVFCARTTDGGMTWKLVSLIGEETVPGGYAIMPSSLRLKDGTLLTMIRRSDPKVSGFIEAWRSSDLGKTWKMTGKAVTGIGGNPPALVQLQDGRVAISYGYRHKPSSMRACISEDGGITWGQEILLREDAVDGDIGYPRAVTRPDGRVMTIYYYNGPKEEDRAIEGTLWAPPVAGKKGEANAPAASAVSEDWGAYVIVPSTTAAQNMVLEATNAGKAKGTPVSVNKPVKGAAHQKWLILPATGNGAQAGQVVIKAAHAPDLVLSVADGSNKMGTLITLEPDKGEKSQRWTLIRRDNGGYSLEVASAPGMGMDHFGGNATPGSKVDLWKDTGKDSHLQWFIRPLAGTGIAQASEAEETTAKYEPRPIKPEDIKRGEIKKFNFTQSAIFPGTTREVTVFIPAQYDGSKAACVYVKTDGFNAKEQDFMETMISSGEMPVTIGVFVRPGELPTPIPGTAGRRNRCFEYDAVNDNNVRFFIEDLLPFVEKEYSLKLSHSGNDRCISGGSSGGITAFNAAWQRPDAFSRVYCASGSFVAFRGGHEFPTLVRKTEPKAIRTFMTTGMRDMENAAGDWFLLDQEMDKAMKFSGYDYIFRIINGGHVAGYMDNYQEAMSYLWKGWPEPVKAGAGAPRMQDVLLPEQPWEAMASVEVKQPRSPVSNAAGNVFFINGTGSILKLDGEGKVAPFVKQPGDASGLSVGADGMLYAVSSKSGKVMSYDAKGEARMIAEGVPGSYVQAMPKGGLYVTTENGDVSWVKDGKSTLVDKAGMKRATGLALRPDQWLLSVADGDSKWVYSYQVNEDGSLVNKERFFWLHVADWDDDAGAESVCYALEGQMFVASRIGVQICADDGPTQVILPVPDGGRVTGVCLGGKDGDTLYAFTKNKVWQRKVKVHAVGAWSPWTKVVPTKL